MKITQEPSSPSPIYRPNIEYFGGVSPIAEGPPSDFQVRARGVIEGQYPNDVIQRIIRNGYDPTIIGYSHAEPWELNSIIAKITELKTILGHSPMLLQEIDPQQLQWIREFLADEAEYSASGTIRGGQAVQPHQLEGLTKYRAKLKKVHGEAFSLWCLENGISIESIEHPDVQQWINQDKGLYEEDSSWLPLSPREFYSAIKRDRHGLELIEQKRPDIISAGYIHALKYDVLLSRDGQNTHLYMSFPIPWEEIIYHWQSSHNRSS